MRGVKVKVTGWQQEGAERIVYAEQGKIPKAIEEIKGVLGTNPENSEAHFFHGQMLEKSGKFDEAIEEFKESIRRNRKHDGAWAALPVGVG